MKIVDLTGDNRGVVGFHVDVTPEGVFGRFEVGQAIAPIAVGMPLPVGTPTVDQVQFKFDKPESVAVFIRQLTKGYNCMSFQLMQEQARKEVAAAVAAKEDKAAKQAALAERIEKMARELSALQGEYAGLND